MVHPHDLFDKAEPWTRRIRHIAKEFIKRAHKVKLCYFPLLLNKRYTPQIIDSIEMIPLNRTPSPKTFIMNTKKLINLCRWADVVHFQKCHHYASIPVVLAAYITKKPLHYDWDDWEEKIWYESTNQGFHSRFIGFSFKVLERFLPLLSDTVSVSSQYLRELAIKFGKNKEDIFPAPVGADLEEFNPYIDKRRIRERYNINYPLVLYIGQLHGAQYAHLFIKAANIVLHKYPNVIFMIVGHGFRENHLRELTWQLGIEDKVIFTGGVSHEEVPYYIASADICVASFEDTPVSRCKSPLKIVEYLASGKPIVASNVGEVRRMVGGVGILVEPNSAKSLAEGILFLLENEDLRKKMGERARRRAERKYNWSYTADSLLSAYYKILNNQREA